MSLQDQVLEVRECKKPGTVMTRQGEVIAIPQGWKLLPPGDATVTRRVKAAGPHWIVKRRKGNKWFSLGVWADAATIARLSQQVKIEKSDPAYQKKIEKAREKRAEQQKQYEHEFRAELRSYLKFHQKHERLESMLVDRITQHAIPVGSGTVARTQRLTTEKKVEAATIAWMRHQTTAYDSMNIPLIKGKRREVRRMLAKKSVQLLERYRRGLEVDLKQCPLAVALTTDSESRA